MDYTISQILQEATAKDSFIHFLEADLKNTAEVAIIYNTESREFSEVFVGEREHNTVDFHSTDVYEGKDSSFVFHTHPEFLGDTTLSESDLVMAKEQIGICALSKEMFELEWEGKIRLRDGTEQLFSISATGDGSGPAEERYIDSISLNN